MCKVLGRFGVLADMVDIIKSIYSTRFFVIKDHTGTSTERRQNAGIAQGCPLSPYLFIAVQTVMLHDAIDTLQVEDEPGYVVTRDVLYADDTLLVSQHQSNFQNMLNAIVGEGLNYGLELNWGKTIHMQISTNKTITTPFGEDIKNSPGRHILGRTYHMRRESIRRAFQKIGRSQQHVQAAEQIMGARIRWMEKKTQNLRQCGYKQIVILIRLSLAAASGQT